MPVSRLYHFCLNLYRKLWHFIGAAMLDQMLVSGVSFFVGFFLARHLGINAFGQFTLVMLISYFCLEMQRAMVIAPMMTLAAQDDTENYLSQLGYVQIGYNLLISLCAAGFITLSAVFFPKWDIGNFGIVGGFSVFSRLQQEFLRRIFFVKNQPFRALTLDFMTFFGILLSIWMLLQTGRLTVVNVIWWHVAAYLCPSFLAMIWVLNPVWQPSRWPEICRQHITFGKWLLGGVAVQFLSTNWLYMSAGAILGASTVGLLKTAQYLLGGVTMLFQALENVVPLKLARLYRHNDHAAVRTYIRYICMFLFVFIVVYIGTMAQLVPFFGHYLKISPANEQTFRFVALQLLLLSSLYGPVLVLTYILRARSMTRCIFYTHLITAAVTVSLAPVIIPIWKESAVIYGTALLQVMVIISFSLFLYRHRLSRHA